jgi:hypothetical protein
MTLLTRVCSFCGGPKKPYAARCRRCHDGAQIGMSRTARFWELVAKGDGCWEWQGYCDRYGMFTWNGKLRKAHRISWELHNGPIPPGMEVCHHCDNKVCVRPDHLFVGTRSDNMRDLSRKGLHPMQSDTPHYRSSIGEGHGMARLTVADVKEIRALKGQKTQREIAQQFGISRQHVSEIHRHIRVWLFVP